MESPSSLIVAYEDDPLDHVNSVRRFISQRISENRPIFPNRKLSLEYAALNNSPKGFPIVSVALSNLQPGDTIFWRQLTWTVLSIDKRLVITDGNDETLRLAPDTRKWEQFCRDMLPEMVCFSGWDKETDLMRAWRRDPIASILEPVG